MENEQSGDSKKALLKVTLGKIKSVAINFGKSLRWSKIKPALNKKFWIIVVCVLVLLICFFGIIGLGAYRMNWDNKFVNAVLRIAPYPAALVNGHVVSFYDWREESKGVLILSKAKFSNVSDLAVQQDVLDKLINDVFMKQLGGKLKIKVVQADIDKKVADLSTQLGSRDVLIANIKQLFGWDLKTFEKRVLFTDVLREKLDTVVGSDASIWTAAEKEANSVLDQLKSGNKTFDELAKLYSADTSNAANGGELGWFARGVMVKEFEDAAFALKVGETSGLVKTQYGYHILTLEDKKAADKKTNTAEQVQVKHILIAPMNVEQYLARMKAEAHITKFVAK